jgi:DNA (cytosine-5)-methyltransferase 3A
MALENVGIQVNNYWSFEIDKHAIRSTQTTHPDTIQMGSVVDFDVTMFPKIDLFIGGSPCQSFSFAGKRKGMSTKDEIEILTLDHYLELKSENYEFEGQSYLFWEFMRALTDLKKVNSDIKFLLENVMMGEKWERILTLAIGVNPIEINSSLVSAQNRRRLYWTNIGMEPSGFFGDLESIIEQPKDKGILLKDILEIDVNEKYFLSEKMISGMVSHTQRMKEKGNGFEFKPTIGNEKSKLLLSKNGSRPDDNFINVVCLTMVKSNIRRLTPRECGRLQTIPSNHLETMISSGISDTQLYKMFGNGWTVDLIAHIFSHIKK